MRRGIKSSENEKIREGIKTRPSLCAYDDIDYTYDISDRGTVSLRVSSVISARVHIVVTTFIRDYVNDKIDEYSD